jgi:hypothetical protein
VPEVTRIRAKRADLWVQFMLSPVRDSLASRVNSIVMT